MNTPLWWLRPEKIVFLDSALSEGTEPQASPTIVWSRHYVPMPYMGSAFMLLFIHGRRQAPVVQFNGARFALNWVTTNNLRAACLFISRETSMKHVSSITLHNLERCLLCNAENVFRASPLLPE